MRGRFKIRYEMWKIEFFQTLTVLEHVYNLESNLQKYLVQKFLSKI